MSGDQLRARIHAVHEKHTGNLSSHGALKWFGKQLGVRGRTGKSVYNWCAEERVPDGPHLVVLALLEMLDPQGSRHDELLLFAIRRRVEESA